MKKVVFAILGLFFVFGLNAHAHQPRIVGEENLIIVTEPEISKAYYGQLDGRPVFYQIKADEPFNLYANILTPAIGVAQKDIRVVIYKDGQVLTILDGSKNDWKKFYEPFGGDEYYQGPEYRLSATAGTYNIGVYSPTNTEKYSLAIGEKESFPLGEIWHTLITLPKLKSDFFGKPAYTFLFNRVGLFLLIFVVLIGLVVYGGYRLYKKHPQKPKK